MSCSDQNMDMVIELAKYAEAIGADYVVVHAPDPAFFKEQDHTLYEYYDTSASRRISALRLWSHPD